MNELAELEDSQITHYCLTFILFIVVVSGAVWLQLISESTNLASLKEKKRKKTIKL
jgi:hypothetical protein